VIRYQEVKISPDQFVELLQASGLAARRPVDDPDCIAGMLADADLLISAWDDGRLVGVARSVTDFSYCCYLSDLAVDQTCQRHGVGVELIRQTRSRLQPTCMLLLLSAPSADHYYPHIGFSRHESAWLVRPGEPLW